MLRSLSLALVLALVPAAGAEAATKHHTTKHHTIYRSRHLWATVNICDTKASPDTLGIRASMPGSGRKGERMFMRFRAQYRSAADGLWHNFLSDGTDSGYLPVGAAKYKARQSGFSFPFSLDPGQQVEVRGVVEFQWRKRKKVVRRAVKRTTKGHKTSMSEPKGYSAATCVLKGT